MRNVRIFIIRYLLAACFLTGCIYPCHSQTEGNTSILLDDYETAEMEVSFYVSEEAGDFLAPVIVVGTGVNILYSILAEFKCGIPSGFFLFSFSGTYASRLETVPGDAFSDRKYLFRITVFREEGRIEWSCSGPCTESSGTFLNVPSGRFSRYTLTSFPGCDKVYDVNLKMIDGHIEEKGHLSVLLLVFILLFDVALFMYIRYRRRKNEDRPDVRMQTGDGGAPRKKEEKHFISEIHLFGGLKIYDMSGREISRMSPMEKELFLLLLCHTPEKGISSQKLKEILWLDKNEASAKNNRAVYFARIRTLLKNVGGCEIVSEKDGWKLLAEGIKVDYYQLCDIFKRKTSEVQIKEVLNILRNGIFLQYEEYEWLDDVKSEVSDRILTILGEFLLSVDLKQNPALAMEAAEIMSDYDPLNEIALAYRCRAYRELGRHMLAKRYYNSFIREYAELYGEEYPRNFAEIMSDPDPSELKEMAKMVNRY